MHLATRIAASAAALISALPSAASAGGALGVSIGQSTDEQGYTGEANRTLGVWGRMSFNRRVSGQLELQKTESRIDSSHMRSGTALIVIELRERGQLMPVLLAGAGLDRVSYFGGGVTMEGRHFEGGLGLEYRANGGFFFGADVRIGGRSIENDDVILAGPEPRPPLDGPALIAPGIAEGEYRALRLTAGVRF